MPIRNFRLISLLTSFSLLTTAIVIFLAPNSSHAQSEFIVDFEDVGSGLSSEQFYNGSDGAGGFESQSVQFNNTHGTSGGFEFWDGWSYSNITDNTTAGFGNQYSAAAGSGAAASQTYGVAFSDTATVAATKAREIIFDFSITNTTYAAISMRDGDAFGKQFGGDSGNDEDFFKIDIEGFDAGGNPTGSQEFYLADYRFADNSFDYIITDWTTIDVSQLNAQRLEFRFSGSDVGQFGLNTPAYFAADNFRIVESVPEPNSILVLSLVGCLQLRRRRRK